MEVSVRQIVKEYNIMKNRLTIELSSTNTVKIDKLIEGIELEKRRVDSELERELYSICETTN